MAEARTKNAANHDTQATALDALAESVESGAGLPETARCAAAALEATVALIDSRGAVLAVAAASPRGAGAALQAGRRHRNRPARVRGGRRAAALPGARRTARARRPAPRDHAARAGGGAH